ncbi:MAG: pyridoxamine 5'-phosphate oxidase family protein [Rubrimonas sp.]
MTEGFDDAFRDDLDATLDQAWLRLARGAADRRSGMHTITVATMGPDGPQARTVVLRGADRAARTIRFHTDARAPKIAELTAEPRVSAVAYDPRAKIQIRLNGHAAVHGGGAAADAAWAGSAPGSRLCYRAPLPPGTPLRTPGEADPTDALRAADSETGRPNFRAVLVTVARIDWLYLAASGHRRAGFAWDGAAWRGRWLAP